MKIFKDHHAGKTTYIVAGKCTNGCQTFGVGRAQEVFDKYAVSGEHRADVLAHLEQSLSDGPDEFAQVCARYGHALEYVPQEHRTPELCAIACAQDGYALEYVPKEHRTPELCAIACAQDGKALTLVPQERRTPELCAIACANDGRALVYVPEEHRTTELRAIANKSK